MMPLLKDGLSFKPLLNSFTDVIFHHSVVVLLLTQCCAGQSQVVGPSQPIVATVGDDIILPCRLDPAADASDMTVEWSRSDLDPRFVHVWRDGVELENKKHPSYKGRTSVSINNLRHGDVSLKLSKVKLSDDGKYKCFIPTLGRESTVDLVVGSVSSPQINISKVSSGVILQCESKGWYPEPEVVWLDGEGNLLSAGPTETVRGPDGLYTVSSRVTVEKRHSNNFTCRVQQKDIHQTRETHIYVPDDVFLVPSSSAVRIGINFAVCFLCVLVLVFAVWKRRQPKIKIRNNMSEDEAEPGEKKITYNSVAELQFLIEEGRDGELHMTGKETIEYLKRKMKKLSEALQRNKEEEYKDVVHAVDSLKEYKEALDKHKSELNHLSGCMNNQLVLVKRLLKEAVLSTTKTNYMEMIEELWKRIEATKNLLEITEKLLQRTEEEIGQKTARKHELELLKEQINKTLQENQRAETQEELQTEQPEREEG